MSSGQTHSRQDILAMPSRDLIRLADQLGIPSASVLPDRQLREKVCDVLRQRGHLEGAIADAPETQRTSTVVYGSQDGEFDCGGQTVAALIEELQDTWSMDPNHLRVTVGGTLVPREQWAKFTIPAGAPVDFGIPGGDKGDHALRQAA